MRTLWVWLGLVLLSIALALATPFSGIAPFWPAVAALAVILVTRQAAIGLSAGVVAGSIIIAGGNPLEAVRVIFADHLFPALGGSWHISALVFTLLLGAFAGILESSGGFERLLGKLLRGSRTPERRVLGSIYGLGLLCFFDGLANSMLTGRISRDAVDRTGISREKLAWVVDSTSSPVACVAFISTWIATQLTLIGDNLPGLNAYELYFRSIPGNPYCLLTLLLVPLAIFVRWEPGPMRRFQPLTPEGPGTPRPDSAAWRALVPLGVLAVCIALSFQIWSGEPIRLFSLNAWREAASGNAGPIALVAGAIGGLIAAWLCHPNSNERSAGTAAVEGAGGLLPAIVILILAWSLGSVFEALGAAEAVKGMLGEHVPTAWLPLAVFATAAATAFITGSSWGTMALLMPLALGVLDPADAPTIAPAVIGAVFGGAVFGDHASPFSDTTIVSALAAGCRPFDHVISQLPYALTAASAAGAAYLLIAVGIHAALATAISALGMILAIVGVSRRQAANSRS
ncbi:sodium/proton antiporter [Haloferula helveola]|uniref:Sodium/proton antiporter n=1 Tax=Haloferula helveola TaxID=490095 RepID=A0ABM7R8C9_9BACT|nr:sodium/proton antiporter [Haloferula helveola]